MSGNGDQPRQPRDLSGLLKFCRESTKSEDAPASTVTEMNEERRAWLSDVLSSMTEDPVKRLQAAIELISNVDTDGTDEMEESFDVVADYCEDLDLAQDFVKIGGFTLILSLLERPTASTRACSANLIAVCCQNNPFCQQAALEMSALPKLLRLVDEDSTASVKAKALYAVSCLVRGSEEGQDAFLSSDGFNVLLRAMQGEIQRVQIKAAFLVGAMCGENSSIKETLTNMGMVTQLCALLATEHDDFRQQLLFALCSVCRENPAAARHLSEAQLDTWLPLHVQRCQNKDECLEEIEYCEELQTLLKGDPATETPAR